MITEQDVVEGLTRYYHELDQSISERPPRWYPERPRGSSVGSWRMQLLATAALVLLLIGAGLLFYQARLLNRNVPVTTPSPNIVRYQTMVRADAQRMTLSESSACGTLPALIDLRAVRDNACPTTIANLTAAMQRWLDDLNRLPPPPAFSAASEALRQHVAAALTDLHAMADAFEASDDVRLHAGLYAIGNDERAANQLAAVIASGHDDTAAVYLKTVRNYQAEMEGCSGTGWKPGAADSPLLNCEPILTQPVCFGDERCLSSAITLWVVIERIQSAIANVTPPSARAGDDVRLRDDLATAHMALDEMLTALRAVPTATTSHQFASGQQALVAALDAFTADVGKISTQAY